MSSPASRADLDFGLPRERAIAQEFIAAVYPGAQLVGCAEYSHLDFAVVRAGKMVCYLEVKARRVASTAFASTIVNWTKYEAATALLRYFKIPSFSIVQFTDRTGYFTLDVPDDKQFIARGDRDNAGCDHACYNLARFTWLPAKAPEMPEIPGL